MKCRKAATCEIEEDELDAVELESTHTIDIDEFVPADEIDERYLDRPYYIAPDGKPAAEAFAVIRDAMKRKGKVALGRIVLTNREHVMALKPLGKGLLGTTLRYPYELRDEDDYFKGIPSPRVSKEMIDLAAHILDTKAAKFDPKKFKDKYETALKKLVKRKAAGKTIEAPEREEAPEEAGDLMEALRQSLGRRPSARRQRGTSRRRTARAPKRRAGRQGGVRLAAGEPPALCARILLNRNLRRVIDGTRATQTHDPAQGHPRQ